MIDPYRRFVAALLLRAIRDAMRKRPWPSEKGPGSPEEARAWLAGPEAAMWASFLDLDITIEEFMADMRKEEKNVGEGHRR